MALTKTNRIDVIDSFQDFLGDKVKLDADWLKFFDEYKKQIAAEKAIKVSNADKPRRTSNAYNIYVAEQMAVLKVSQPDLSVKDRMKTVMGMWKAYNASVAHLASSPSSIEARAGSPCPSRLCMKLYVVFDAPATPNKQ